MDLRIRLSAKVDQEGRLVWNEPARFRAWAALAKGKIVQVTLERFRSRRTAAQNSRYWTALVPFAMEVFEQRTGMPFTKEMAHHTLKLAFLGNKFMEAGGVLVPVPDSSAELDIDKFNEFTQQVEAWIWQEFKVKPELIDAEAFS